MTIKREFTVFLVLLFLLGSFSANAQNEFGAFKSSHKGEMFISWGWNWSAYSNSNIQFTGNDYDFTLRGVRAVDRQSPFSADTYFNPVQFTTPQVNFRIGYFISDHYNVSFAVDHMKYIVEQYQTVKIDGTINLAECDYNGVYNNEDIRITPVFLQFEHTDGLNYANFSLARHDDLWKVEKMRMTVGVTEGVSVGMLYPKTNTQLLGKERYDNFHVAGYGLDLRAGLNLNFFKYVFIVGELKGGFINMPDIRTTHSKDDKAKQNFFFVESSISLGVIFPLSKPTIASDEQEQ